MYDLLYDRDLFLDLLLNFFFSAENNPMVHGTFLCDTLLSPMATSSFKENGR